MISLRGSLKKEQEKWKWVGTWSFGASLDESKALPFEYSWGGPLPLTPKKSAAQLSFNTPSADQSENDVSMEDVSANESEKKDSEAPKKDDEKPAHESWPKKEAAQDLTNSPKQPETAQITEKTEPQKNVTKESGVTEAKTVETTPAENKIAAPEVAQETSKSPEKTEMNQGKAQPKSNERALEGAAVRSTPSEEVKTTTVTTETNHSSSDAADHSSRNDTTSEREETEEEGETWKLDENFSDASEKLNVPSVGQWKGYFKTLGPRKNTFSQVSETIELYFNGSPPSECYIQFPDEEDKPESAAKLPEKHIHVRGRGQNQYGSFELLGSVDMATIVLTVQRVYVKTTTTPRSPRSRRRSSSVSQSVRQSRKRQLSWKRRDALDAGDNVATKRIRKSKTSPTSSTASKPASIPSAISTLRIKSPEANVPTMALPKNRSAPSVRPTSQSSSSSGIKLPPAGEPALARWRSAHFLYYQRHEPSLPSASASTKPAPATGSTVSSSTSVASLNATATTPTPTPKYVIYEGEMHNSKREGRGMCLFHDQMYQGEWHMDQEHGQGKLLDHHRRVIYEGEWERGRMHGRGRYQYSSDSYYEGEFRENLRHGMGTYLLSSSDKGKCSYHGYWRDGFPSGQGVMEWPDGSVYEGEWKDGKRHGQGLLKTSDGFTYDGNWDSNAMDGRGWARYPSGQEYHGLFSNGRREGRGTITFANGAVYEGRFRDDAIDGQGTMKMSQSTVVPNEKSGEKEDFMIPISFQSDISHVHRKAGFTVGGN